MAAAAGFHVERRDADMAGATFDDLAEHHVTVYRLGPGGGHLGAPTLDDPATAT